MKSKNRGKAWAIGAFIIGSSIVAIAFMTLPNYSVYFYTTTEALADYTKIKNRDIKIGGMVIGGSTEWNAQELDLKFSITDLDGTIIKVVHKGTPPDMFKENSGVVVEGRLVEGGRKILSKHLMVKHSEEYKIPDQKHSIDKELLEKSIFKGVRNES